MNNRIFTNLYLRYQWGAFIMMLPIIPFTQYLAFDPSAGFNYTLLTYPFAHANILHWLLNYITWMYLWRFVSIWRLFVSYISAVMAAVIYYFFCQLLQLDTLPICGFSSIICFYIGLLVPVNGFRFFLRLLPLLIFQFILPGFAASIHMICLIFGIAYSTYLHNK